MLEHTSACWLYSIIPQWGTVAWRDRSEAKHFIMGIIVWVWVGFMGTHIFLQRIALGGRCHHPLMLGFCLGIYTNFGKANMCLLCLPSQPLHGCPTFFSQNSIWRGKFLVREREFSFVGRNKDTGHTQHDNGSLVGLRISRRITVHAKGPRTLPRVTKVPWCTGAEILKTGMVLRASAGRDFNHRRYPRCPDSQSPFRPE